MFNKIIKLFLVAKRPNYLERGSPLSAKSFCLLCFIIRATQKGYRYNRGYSSNFTSSNKHSTYKTIPYKTVG